jgi:hypothetical protein
MVVLVRLIPQIATPKVVSIPSSLFHDSIEKIFQKSKIFPREPSFMKQIQLVDHEGNKLPLCLVNYDMVVPIGLPNF